MLRVAIRSTLNRHGIPIAWIGADVSLANSRGREPGVHLRLMLRHWDPRLLTHAVALQNSLIERVMTFDPLASTWLTGISWQFDLPDEGSCPPLPPAGSWTAAPPDEGPVAVQSAIAELVRNGPAAGPAAAGPDQSADDVKSDLEQLIAVRDAELRLHAQQLPAEEGPEATQPMYLQTQPMQRGTQPTYSRTEPMPLE
jgi:hypothetical protein